MKLIFDIFLYTFEMIITFVFISYNYEKKHNKNLNTFIVGFFIFLIGAIILTFINDEIPNLIVFFTLNLFFIILCFKIKLKEAIIYSALLDAIMFGAEMITIFLSSYIMKIPTDTYKTNPTTFYILTIISKIIYFAVAQFIAFIINKLKFKSNNSTRFIPLFIFPFISIAISVLFLRMSFVNNYDNRYNISFIILNIIMIIACIYVFIYYQRLAKSDAYLNELQTENKLLEINNDYIEVLKHQNNEMRMLFHDTKNHFLTIANIDNIEEIDSYIKGVIGDIQKYDIVQLTNNKLLDLLLSKYSALSNNNNIKLNIEVRTANLDYVPDSDLSMLINNLMDNAFESAKQSREKVIDFSLIRVNNFDILKVSNSCDTPPIDKAHKLLTTKKSKAEHGFGTRIIEKYAKKNNAEYEWLYENDKKLFITTIIFKH